MPACVSTLRKKLHLQIARRICRIVVGITDRNHLTDPFRFTFPEQQPAADGYILGLTKKFELHFCAFANGQRAGTCFDFDHNGCLAYIADMYSDLKILRHVSKRMKNYINLRFENGNSRWKNVHDRAQKNHTLKKRYFILLLAATVNNAGAGRTIKNNSLKNVLLTFRKLNSPKSPKATAADCPACTKRHGLRLRCKLSTKTVLNDPSKSGPTRSSSPSLTTPLAKRPQATSPTPDTLKISSI